MQSAMYRKFESLVTNKKHRLFIDLSLYATAGYLTLTKFTSWSIATPLGSVLTPDSMDILAKVIPWALGYVVLMRGVMYILDAFPGSRVTLSTGDGLSHCCMRINDEITQHMKAVESDPDQAKATLIENHGFKLNLALVVQCLHQHISDTLSGARSRDVFVSVYTTENFESPQRDECNLSYETHQPINKDGVVSRKIDIGDRRYEDYEMVKCIKEDLATRLLLNCQSYHRSNSKRHKRIKHYLGMKLQCDGTLIGFINIELYNTVFFSTEDEMSDYIEEQLLPFRYLIEYQCLKRMFFTLVDQKLLN